MEVSPLLPSSAFLNDSIIIGKKNTGTKLSPSVPGLEQLLTDGLDSRLVWREWCPSVDRLTLQLPEPGRYCFLISLAERAA